MSLYYNTTIIDTLGNWSADKKDYLNVTDYIINITAVNASMKAYVDSLSKLTNDAKELKRFLNDQTEITTVYMVPTYDELKKELDLYLNGPAEAEEGEAVNVSTPDLDDIDDVTDDDLDAVMDDFDSLVD